MIEKLRKKFIIWTMAAVFALLFAVLSVINITNFVLVASDADHITESLVEQGGKFDEPLPIEGEQGGFFPGGPLSPETSFSTRYFAFTVTKDGAVKKIAYHISAFTEEEAEEIALSLVGSRNKTGWTHKTYRYRLTEKKNETTVVVIDQGRELRPSYQVLAISLVGSIVGAIVVLLVMIPVSKRLVKPLETSDTRQKRFIADAAREIKIPITVLAANDEVSDLKEDIAKSNRKQIKKLTKLVEDLDSLLVFEKTQKIEKENLDVAEIADRTIAPYEELFVQRKVRLEKNYSSPTLFLSNENMLKKALVELYENGLKYAKTFFEVSVSLAEERLVIETRNDCEELPEGDLDRVFERFYRLQNGVNSEKDGSGVGLAIVREIVSTLGGRYRATGKDGVFFLRIEL